MVRNYHGRNKPQSDPWEGFVSGFYFLKDGRVETSWDNDFLLHRDGDLPAAVSGMLVWAQHGKRFRQGAPAVIWNNDNAFEWFESGSGQRHRDGAPARIYKGGKRQWWHEGKLHRIDGPAIIAEDGKEHFWLDGVRLPDERAYINKLGEMGIPYERDRLQKNHLDATFEGAFSMHGVWQGKLVKVGGGINPQELPHQFVESLPPEVRDKYRHPETTTG
jgi:hypothetical protein